MFTLKIRAG